LKSFGLDVFKKNQGLVKKRNLKRNTMIKPSQQDSRIPETKESLKRSQIKRRICQKYNASTVENMVTTRIIVLS
jgi:phage tail tape-measure protein